MNKASDAINQPGDKDESFPDKIAKWKKDVDSWTDVWKKACEVEAKTQGMSEYPRSAIYYFDDLPQPLQMTKTDADGKFSFKVRSGSGVLVGRFQSAGGRTCYRKPVIPANGVLTLDETTNCLSGKKGYVCERKPIHERLA